MASWTAVVADLVRTLSLSFFFFFFFLLPVPVTTFDRDGHLDVLSSPLFLFPSFLLPSAGVSDSQEFEMPVGEWGGLSAILLLPPFSPPLFLSRGQDMKSSASRRSSAERGPRSTAPCGRVLFFFFSFSLLLSM